jgi:hypothetical protein
MTDVTSSGSVVVAVLFALVAFAACGYAIMRFSAGKRRSWHRGHRGMLVRCLCGIAGAAILASLWFGTSRHISLIYVNADAKSTTTVRVAAASAESDYPAQSNSGRMLLHFIFAEVVENGFRPLHSDQMDLQLPRDSGTKHSISGAMPHYRYEISVEPETFNFATQPGEALMYGNITYRVISNNSSSSGELHIPIIDRSRALTNILVKSPMHPLSILPRTAVRHVALLAMVEPCAIDDPLRSISLEEFARDHDLSDSAHGPIYSVRLGSFKHPGSPAAFHFFHHIGLSWLLMVAASILLAQLFVRRSLAWAGTLAVCILYVAALDRWALSQHQSRLENGALGVGTRSIAADCLTTTFFYRKTAARIAGVIAEGIDVPEQISRSARFSEQSLR